VHGLADIVAGHQAALATLAALAERRRTGQGCVVDLSQLEAMAAQIGPDLLARTAAAGDGAVASTSGSAPEGVYRCLGPDRWVAVTVPTDGAWKALCTVLERPDLAEDPRFATAAGRVRHQQELDAAITAWTSPRSAGDIAERLQAAAIPAGAVQDGRDLVEHDPQLRAGGFYRVLDHPRAGPFLHEGIPIRLSSTPGDLWEPAPLLGVDTTWVLENVADLTPSDITTLRISGALE
jgi:crotonobetainyl-CoA:carnitine CoA-transferase CaiB-like acyl-CoA transferase